MPLDRPTFHEAWYRVVGLRPRLLPGVNVYRQNFRGDMWYVLENPVNNKFSRIGPGAYRFLALLDGRRTVGEVWDLTNRQLGDDAPTQGEAIRLLGQLYCDNLIYAEVAPDTESLFKRYRKRLTRQVQSVLSNLLFIRIPLLDPDAFLDRWVGVFGRIFTPYGFAAWAVLVIVGIVHVIANFGELVDAGSNIFDPGNLVLLYASFVLIKVCHEFGHAFACKRFGQIAGNGGEVHVMGVMFLVFVPVPYLDASSAWAFRSKGHRAIVGAAGVFVELGAAAIAAVVWASTSPGTLHSIAYNAIFIASISALIFNGNPLLRFDAYYVLSDLIEIPNLSQRSRAYLEYLVKAYVWRVRGVKSPAYTLGERIWFPCYGVASTAYRVYLCIVILLFLNDRLPAELFILVPVFAGSAVLAWVLVPLGKFIRYLATGPDLARTRGRAVGTTATAVLALSVCLGAIPFPDRCRVEGLVEPLSLAVIHAESDGFVVNFLPSGASVSPAGDPLIVARNPALDCELKSVLAELRALEIERRLARLQELAAVRILDEKIAALEEKADRVRTQLASLRLRTPISGTWIAPDVELLRGAYLHRGQPVGLVADLTQVRIRAMAGQELAGLVVERALPHLQMRLKGRPAVFLEGTIEGILPAGHEELPSESLGYAAGGAMPILPADPRGLTTAERFFEVRIRPVSGTPCELLPGQRVVARLELPPEPLAAQWWRALRQLLQRRFQL